MKKSLTHKIFNKIDGREIELDISIPNAPLFSYPMILPFEGIEFTISTELKCALVTSINSGALFTNTISAEWDGGNNSVTTLPYIIETPLLVITDVTNTLTSAAQGETITRTITIQNTQASQYRKCHPLDCGKSPTLYPHCRP